MTFDELYESLPNEGWLSKPEAEFLLECARKTEGPILEVGCYCGRSTIALASLGRPVITVDPFKNFNDDDKDGTKTHAKFLENLRNRNVFNVSLYKVRIENWKPQPVGFAFLDGDHSCRGTLNQIDVALACGVTSLCIHDWDYSEGGLEVKRAIEEHPKVSVQKVVETMAYCEI